MPALIARNSGQSEAIPRCAASTWSHAPCAAQASAISGTGSTACVEVVPTAATQKKGRWPAAASASIMARSAAGSMERSARTGTMRRLAAPRPAMRMSFSMLLCACVLA